MYQPPGIRRSRISASSVCLRASGKWCRHIEVMTASNGSCQLGGPVAAAHVELDWAEPSGEVGEFVVGLRHHLRREVGEHRSAGWVAFEDRPRSDAGSGTEVEEGERFICAERQQLRHDIAVQR